MSTSHKIQGTVSYHDIGPGFWGIIDDQGRKWRPVKMPKELRKAGIKGTFEIEEVEEGMSIFMWGTAVKVVEFALE